MKILLIILAIINIIMLILNSGILLVVVNFLRTLDESIAELIKEDEHGEDDGVG